MSPWSPAWRRRDLSMDAEDCGPRDSPSCLLHSWLPLQVASSGMAARAAASGQYAAAFGVCSHWHFGSVRAMPLSAPVAMPSASGSRRRRRSRFVGVAIRPHAVLRRNNRAPTPQQNCDQRRRSRAALNLRPPARARGSRVRGRRLHCPNSLPIAARAKSKMLPA